MTQEPRTEAGRVLPTTPTGVADHDRAWAAADNGDIDGIASHAGLRESCPACFGIAAIEAEARQQGAAEPLARYDRLVAAVRSYEVRMLDPEASVRDTALAWQDVADLLASPPDAEAPAEAAERALADALLVWYDTTHGNRIGEHDHHCRAARWQSVPHPSGLLIQAGPNAGQPLMVGREVTTGEPCTCGWEGVARAVAARANR